MSQELIYTSAPRGLKPGSRGFCTVLSTRGMSAPLAAALESLSGYRAVFPPGDPRVSDNPVVFSHVHLAVAGKSYSVLSRVSDYGLDYSQRANKIAHHLVLERKEQVSDGPAAVLSQPGNMESTWSGDPRVIPTGRSVTATSAPPAICRAWQQATGDASWAGVLAESFQADPERRAYLVIAPGMDVLPLIAEAINLLPEQVRWNVTFSAYFTSLPPGATCQWRCVLAGSDEAQQSRRFVQALRIDLTQPMPRATGGALVEQARTGRVAAPTTVASPSPSTSAPSPADDPAPTGGPPMVPLDGGGPGARPASGNPPPPPRKRTRTLADVPDEPPRRWLVPAILAVVMLLLLGSGAMGVYRWWSGDGLGRVIADVGGNVEAEESTGTVIGASRNVATSKPAAKDSATRENPHPDAIDNTKDFGVTDPTRRPVEAPVPDTFASVQSAPNPESQSTDDDNRPDERSLANMASGKSETTIERINLPSDVTDELVQVWKGKFSAGSDDISMSLYIPEKASGKVFAVRVADGLDVEIRGFGGKVPMAHLRVNRVDNGAFTILFNWTHNGPSSRPLLRRSILNIKSDTMRRRFLLNDSPVTPTQDDLSPRISSDRLEWALPLATGGDGNDFPLIDIEHLTMTFNDRVYRFEPVPNAIRPSAKFSLTCNEFFTELENMPENIQCRATVHVEKDSNTAFLEVNLTGVPAVRAVAGQLDRSVDRLTIKWRPLSEIVQRHKLDNKLQPITESTPNGVFFQDRNLKSINDTLQGYRDTLNANLGDMPEDEELNKDEKNEKDVLKEDIDVLKGVIDTFEEAKVLAPFVGYAQWKNKGTISSARVYYKVKNANDDCLNVEVINLPEPKPTKTESTPTK